MVAVRSSVALVDDLSALASSLESLDLRSAVFDGSTHETRDRLVRTLRSYLIPRLENGSNPLSVVFAGPTGSGKSTLVNSLSGIKVSETGPIRPTTSEPVVLAGESAAAAFEVIGGVECAVVPGAARILERMALIDTPDIDSTETGHRVIAETLIDHSDVVVFVTSALRYADLVPWQVLRRAVSRGTPVIHVLNRVTGDSSAAAADFRSRLDDAGYSDELIRVPEHHMGVGAHAIPSLAVTGLRRRLAAIADDRDRYQQEVLDRVLLASLDQATDLAAQVESAAAHLEIAEADVATVFAGGFQQFDPAPLAEPLELPAPPLRGWLKRRRWLKQGRSLATRHRDHFAAPAERISAAIETDVGVRAVSIPGLADSAPDLARRARPVIENAIAGWFDSLIARVGTVPERDRPLAAMVLSSAALAGNHQEAAALLFRLDRDGLVGAARHDLLARVEVVYTHAADLALGRLRDGEGTPSADDLADRLASVVVTSHFADA